MLPSNTLMQAHHQWATRPQDERYVDLISLHAANVAMRQNSTAKVLPNRALQAAPIEGDHRGLVVVGPNGDPVNVTNWGFNQLAQRAGCPSGFLRELPSDLAADCINDGLHRRRDVEEVGVLVRGTEEHSGGRHTLACVTGPNYGRVWQETVSGALVRHFGDGRTGDFRIPGEFGREVTITKDNTTLYRSDRDMFVFLADEVNRIEIKDRRDGRSGSLARGFFVWNSETGSTTVGIAGFLFDYVCCNRIVWGARDYQELRIRHTAGAPDRWIEEAMPAIEAYRNHSTDSIEQAINDARRKRIDNVDEFLVKRFSKSQVSAIKAAHMADEQRPIETLWDAATAVTAYARGVPYQDQRVDLERAGGKILALAE